MCLLNVSFLLIFVIIVIYFIFYFCKKIGGERLGKEIGEGEEYWIRRRRRIKKAEREEEE